MNILIPSFSFVSLLSSILLFIINPGIVYSNKNNNEKAYCDACKFSYPIDNKKMHHCFLCGVCITNYDHHCGVIGRCVGKYNIIIFFIFVVSNTGFICCFYLIIFNLVRNAIN